MRRPGPLPPPEERTARRPLDDRHLERDVRDRRDPVGATGDGGAEVTPEPRRRAPLLPFRIPRPEAEEPAPGGVQDEADRPGYGWRAVWRAARARRRALRSEIRRFTARSRRRRTIWLVSLSALLLLVVGSVGAAYSPLFAVQRITFTGVEALDETALQEALSGQVGRPLPLIDHGEIKAALVGFPLIETYTIEARPPHDLVVAVVERTPVGVVRSDAGFTVVDAAGVVLSTTDERPKGQPEIQARGGLSSPAFSAVGQVLRSMPAEVHDRVRSARATTADDVTLVLDDGTEVVWGSAEDSAKKATLLLAAPGGHGYYDVSSPGAIIVG